MNELNVKRLKPGDLMVVLVPYPNCSALRKDEVVVFTALTDYGSIKVNSGYVVQPKYLKLYES